MADLISHARLMQWSYWFAGMLDARPTDRLYDCLPMYHSVGGVLAPGAILAAGGSLVIAGRFSASQFWDDVNRWDCTLLQYIGELCRYLLQAPAVKGHKIRIASPISSGAQRIQHPCSSRTGSSLSTSNRTRVGENRCAR